VAPCKLRLDALPALGEATIEATRLRSREAREAMSFSTPSSRIIASSAATWPWGSERRISKAPLVPGETFPRR